jgi:purine-binding chemotaxis protein CheW
VEEPDLLVFLLGAQRYALPLGAVHEVLRAVAIARLPNAPDIVEGVVNLRGRPIPVLDLRRRLGVPARVLDPSEHLIVARIGGRTAAFRVDRAERVASLDRSVFETAEAIAPGVRHLPRIASDDAGVVFIHDPERFLTEAEASRLDQSLSEAS